MFFINSLLIIACIHVPPVISKIATHWYVSKVLAIKFKDEWVIKTQTLQELEVFQRQTNLQNQVFDIDWVLKNLEKNLIRKNS